MTTYQKLPILEMWQDRIAQYILKNSPYSVSDLVILNDLCELAALSIKQHSNSPTDPVKEKLEKFARNIAG